MDEGTIAMKSSMDVTLPVESQSLPLWQRKAIHDSPFSTPRRRPKTAPPESGKKYHREHKVGNSINKRGV